MTEFRFKTGDIVQEPSWWDGCQEEVLATFLHDGNRWLLTQEIKNPAAPEEGELGVDYSYRTSGFFLRRDDNVSLELAALDLEIGTLVTASGNADRMRIIAVFEDDGEKLAAVRTEWGSYETWKVTNLKVVK